MPVAVEPSITLRVGWQSEHLYQRKRSIDWEVDLLDPPKGSFFGERSEQAQQTGMSGIACLGGMQQASLTGDHRKAERSASVSELQEGFDQAKTGQHSLLLRGKYALLRQREL
jgi:hypothetical protein